MGKPHGVSVMRADLDAATSTTADTREAQWRAGVNRQAQPAAVSHQQAASQAAAVKRKANAMTGTEKESADRRRADRRNEAKRARRAAAKAAEAEAAEAAAAEAAAAEAAAAGSPFFAGMCTGRCGDVDDSSAAALGT